MTLFTLNPTPGTHSELFNPECIFKAINIYANINKFNYNLHNMCLVFKTKHKITLKELVLCSFTTHWTVSSQTLYVIVMSISMSIAKTKVKKALNSTVCLQY